jgi:hypothetical protein
MPPGCHAGQRARRRGDGRRGLRERPRSGLSLGCARRASDLCHRGLAHKDDRRARAAGDQRPHLQQGRDISLLHIYRRPGARSRIRRLPRQARRHHQGLDQQPRETQASPRADCRPQCLQPPGPGNRPAVRSRRPTVSGYPPATPGRPDVTSNSAGQLANGGCRSRLSAVQLAMSVFM